MAVETLVLGCLDFYTGPRVTLRANSPINDYHSHVNIL